MSKFSTLERRTTPPGVKKEGPGPTDYDPTIPDYRIHQSLHGTDGPNLPRNSPGFDYLPSNPSGRIGPLIHGQIGQTSKGNSLRSNKHSPSTKPGVSIISGNEMKIIPVDPNLKKVLGDIGSSSGGKTLESNDTTLFKLEAGSIGNSGDLNRHSWSSEEGGFNGFGTPWVEFDSAAYPGGSGEFTLNSVHSVSPFDKLSLKVFPENSPSSSIRNQSPSPDGNPQSPGNIDGNTRVGNNGTGSHYQSSRLDGNIHEFQRPDNTVRNAGVVPNGFMQSPGNRPDGNIVKPFENGSIFQENFPPPRIIEGGEDMWTNVNVDPSFVDVPLRASQRHMVPFRDPQLAPLSLVYLGIIIALVCTITGLLQTVLERTPWHSIFAGIFQMILGMLAVLLEASQISPSGVQTNSKRLYNILLWMNRKPFYAKSAFYVVTGIIPLVVFASWETGLGSGGIILLGLIYLIYTLLSRD